MKFSDLSPFKHGYMNMTKSHYISRSKIRMIPMWLRGKTHQLCKEGRFFSRSNLNYRMFYRLVLPMQQLLSLPIFKVVKSL